MPLHIERENVQLYSQPPKLLDIIIPTYKRPQGAVVAGMSVLSQLKQYNIQNYINLTIWDDCTPDLNIDQISLALTQYAGLFRIGQNKSNKGMSRNICDLVEAAKSEFCTVLTDDDWFECGSLPEILEEIKQARSVSKIKSIQNPGAFFVPRYSYLDNGSLHCIECTPFQCDSIISKSPVNVIKYCRNAFILTGLFFRPSLVNFPFWRANQENAFFPLIYYASISISSDVKYLNRKWLHHTCDNLCHWEAWGSSDLQRNTRLHQDYLRALILVAHAYPAGGVADRLQHAKYLCQAFLNQLSTYGGPALNQLLVVFPLLRHSFLLACTYLVFLIRRLVLGLKLNLIHLLRNFCA
jgi:hypothetical protein